MHLLIMHATKFMKCAYLPNCDLTEQLRKSPTIPMQQQNHFVWFMLFAVPTDKRLPLLRNTEGSCIGGSFLPAVPGRSKQGCEGSYFLGQRRRPSGAVTLSGPISAPPPATGPQSATRRSSSCLPR